MPTKHRNQVRFPLLLSEGAFEQLATMAKESNSSISALIRSMLAITESSVKDNQYRDSQLANLVHITGLHTEMLSAIADRFSEQDQ